MKPTLVALFLLATVAVKAETRYYTVAFKNDRLGYSAIEEGDGTFAGTPAHWTRSRGIGSLTYGGTPIRIEEESVVWTTPEGRPLRQSVTMIAMGRRTKVDAAFGPKTAEIDLEQEGKKSHQSLPIPEGLLVDDPVSLIRKGLKPGLALAFSSFESHALAFQKGTLRTAGTATVEVDGKSVPAVLTEMTDEDGVNKIFTTPGGELLREESPNGFAMNAATKAVALAPIGKPSENADLMILTALRTDKPLQETGPGRLLRLRFSGVDFGKIPADEAQIVQKEGDAWVVQTGPAAFQTSSGAPPIGSIKGQEAYLVSDAYFTSDDPKIKAIAAKLAPKGGVFMYCVPQIRKYVGEKMHYEIGFGDDRPAKEILRKPKGKCTEYAILTVTLLRAAGIPARLAGGLVTEDGTFFRHAWAEAWDGRQWLGVDSTSDSDDLTAGYVKLAQGNVAEAFALPEMGDAKTVKIEVLTPVLPPLVKPAAKTP